MSQRTDLEDSITRFAMETEVEKLGEIMKNKDESGSEQNKPESFVFVADGSDDESIVVLGDSSLDQRESLTAHVKNRQKNIGENSQEMQQKLTDLVRENVQLKEELEQNNSAMNQHLSALVSRQEELAKLYEAHRQKYADAKNLVGVLKAENKELKARIDGFEKDNVEQSMQTENTDEDLKPEASIATVEDDRSTEMIAMAEKCGKQNQEIAHAHRIIASLKDQLQSLYQNLFTPIKLEDLQSTSQTQEEPHRKQFLESFTHYNEKLRELGYCYAALTSHYTSIQDCLQRCSEILLQKQNPIASQSLKSERSEDLQDYRSLLIDEETKTIAERELMMKAQSEFQRIFIDYNSMIFEVESLRKDNDRLNSALQSAVKLREQRQNKSEAAVREKERLVEEQRKEIEQDQKNLLAQKIELQRLDKVNADNLKKTESLLEVQRRVLEKEKADLLAQKTELQRLDKVNADNLKKKESLLEVQRQVLEKDQANLLAQKKERQRMDEACNDNCTKWKNSLEEQERVLKQDKADLLEEKREFQRQKNTFRSDFDYEPYGSRTQIPSLDNVFSSRSGMSESESNCTCPFCRSYNQSPRDTAPNNECNCFDCRIIARQRR